MGRLADRGNTHIRWMGRAILASLLVWATVFSAGVFDDDSGDVDDSSDDVESISRHPTAANRRPDPCPESSTPESCLRVAHLDCGRVWRGGQAQVLMLMEGLARRGVQSLLLAPRGPLLERAQDRGFRCEAWSPKGDWDILAFVRAVRRLRAHRPHVVHCHDARSHAVGVPAACLAGADAVLVSRRVAFRLANNPLSALKYRLPVDRYLCVSRGVLQRLRAAGVKDERLAVVPDAVDLCPTPSPIDLRALIGVPPSAPLVATVAALTPEKGHADLLEAAVRVTRERPDAHFVWLGEGRCEESLLRLRASLGLDTRVHLLGHRADAQSLLGQCNVCALASLEEGLGTSLIEAQALGVPVVATAVGGVPEVVQDGMTGRLVPPRDPAAMAAALLEALSRPDLTRSWSEAGCLAARAFHVDCMVDRTLHEYRAILQSLSPENDRLR